MKLELTTRQLNILAKKGINTYEDIMNTLPRDYMDFRNELTNLRSNAFHDRTGYVKGMLTDVKTSFKNNRSIITAKVSTGDGRVNLTYIGQYNIQNTLSEMLYKPVAVFGKFQYSAEYSSYSMLNPVYVINREEEDYLYYVRLQPVYTKYAGISEATMEKLREQALGECYEVTSLEFPTDYEMKMLGEALMPTKQAYRTVHFPADEKELEAAKKRLAANELWNYAVTLEMQSAGAPKGTTLNIISNNIIRGICDSLPYELTADQKATVNGIIAKWKEGKRVESLIQGDVGCGKTMVAILLLFAVAEANAQCLITAPTQILAEQHFEQIKTFADRFHITCAFLGGNTKAKEKKSILAGLENGSISIVVGTQSLCSDKVVFKNLQLAVIDEEHRFGVEQKEALSKYRQNGCSVVKMTATPIPRTLSGALLGSQVDIYSIKTMPSGRSPIQTAKLKTDAPAFSFIEKQLSEGHQAYVVCPLIDESESETMEDVVSVEEAYSKYVKQFSTNYAVGYLNGKMKKEEMEDTIDAFKNNEIKILVSTSVIEVGVNVPNATVIVIENAERFGLASLHQLRGRVGRGQFKGYCILKSPNADFCERLDVMCNTTDGFVISEEDLRLRGGGNLIGTEQSGISKITETILRYEDMYFKIKKAAEQYINDQTLFCTKPA